MKKNIKVISVFQTNTTIKLPSQFILFLIGINYIINFFFHYSLGEQSTLMKSSRIKRVLEILTQSIGTDGKFLSDMILAASTQDRKSVV